MTLHTRQLLASITFAGLGAGCAAVAPSQLVDAREAYSRSSSGLAARWTPAELADGKKMLDRANAEFDDRGNTSAARDYAYIAGRKFELADSRARIEVDRQRIAEAVAQGVQVRDEQVRTTEVALAGARTQLQRERSANDAAAMVLQAARTPQGAELAQADLERGGRAATEVRLAGAMRGLNAIAAVREDTRGTVITLDGSRLFAFGTATLLDTAYPALDQVAEAVMDQGPDRRTVVEGHTDDVGAPAVNLAFSRDRAQAVRRYLVSRGVDPARLSAVGLGSTRPVLDNASAEHRADNRRVEIVIHAAGLSAR
jgi:outer membrane protein OmpA-like peptidoglycan-associated protein